MRLNRLFGVILMLALATAATACTKVKSSSQSSLSLSGARPTLSAMVTNPEQTPLATGAAEAAFDSPLTVVVEPAGTPAAADSTLTMAVAPPAPTAEPEYTVHNVVWGDTLLDIALIYGVSMDAIAQANGLKDNAIFIGQLLKIPAPSIPTGGQPYTVAYGDSLYSIASAFGIDVADLMLANNITNGYYLQAGQVLAIPSGAVAQSPSGSSVQAASIDRRTHTVQPGDTLFSIAAFYDVSAYDIALTNGLGNPNVLEVGQELIIP
jgi:LysM repeat protein